MNDETLVGRDAASYTPGLDAVATVAVVLTVECNPGHADNVVDFLRGVKDQPGVYAAVVNVTGPKKPEAEAVAEVAVAELPPEKRPGYIVPIEEVQPEGLPKKAAIKPKKAPKKKPTKPKAKLKPWSKRKPRGKQKV